MGAGATGIAVAADMVANSEPIATTTARTSFFMLISFAFALGFAKPLSTPSDEGYHYTL
jgi:hypothetical protein